MGSEELAAAPTLCCESHSAFAAGALRPLPPTPRFLNSPLVT